MSWNEWVAFAARRSAQAPEATSSNSGSETGHLGDDGHHSLNIREYPPRVANEEAAVGSGQPPSSPGLPIDYPDKEPELDLNLFRPPARRQGRPRKIGSKLPISSLHRLTLQRPISTPTRQRCPLRSLKAMKANQLVSKALQGHTPTLPWCQSLRHTDPSMWEAMRSRLSPRSFRSRLRKKPRQ